MRHVPLNSADLAVQPVFLPHEYHLKGWEVVARIRSIANFLGGDNVLQRYVFGGGHWTMVPGYSITFYEQRRTDEELTMIVRC